MIDIVLRQASLSGSEAIKMCKLATQCEQLAVKCPIPPDTNVTICTQLVVFVSCDIIELVA